MELPPLVPETSASANSATSACGYGGKIVHARVLSMAGRKGGGRDVGTEGRRDGG